ncbi:MAG: SRPBCC family protein [Alphaproteobacteria bacterium]|nr:SRPBCC family protein [Alphaproteobacteria bacterium]
MSRTITLAPVRKQVRVNAPQGRAFEVFTAQMTRWWPPTHTILKAPLKEAVIEPREGGRWYHVGTDGSECETGHVRVWDPPSRLVLVWRLDAEWQYDADLDTEVELRFTADGAATNVELEHRYIERMGKDADKAHAAVGAPGGWSALLEAFRNAAEGSQ